MSIPHYSKAPIIEAVIDIQVVLPPDFSVARLSELADELKDKFPIRNKMASIQMKVDANAEDEKNSKFTSSQDELGLRLADNDNSRILQLKKIGFTYSHLPPYSDWSCFSAEAKSYWELFIRYCRPTAVTRCAVRYINRIDIPDAPIAIEDYLNVHPNIPSSIPHRVTGMHMQLQMPLEDMDGTAIINEAIVEPAITKGFSIVVDIDVFRTLNDEPSNIWSILEQLRIKKNALFEEIITDKTRELIR